MKVLLAIDGSPHSGAAIAAVAHRAWPKDTVVQILTVIHPAVPLLPDPILTMASVHEEQAHELRRLAPLLLDKASQQIRPNRDVIVTTKILEGSPKHVIVEEAREWGADLIVVGSRGYGRLAGLALGSVAGAVAADAPCSVEIVRTKQDQTDE